MTINEGISLQKAVRDRVSELKVLRDKVAVKQTTTWFNDKDKKEDVEPQYDVKLVDKKIVELGLFLYKLDSKIKHANAVTTINGLEVDVDVLLAPLQ